MKKSIFAVILVLTILAGLPVFAAGDAAAGKDAYMKKCASCHGTDATVDTTASSNDRCSNA